MSRTTILALIGTLGALVPFSAYASKGLVMTLSNQPSGSSIITYVRHANGRLSRGNVYPTGGLGTGSGTGSQGAISVSKDGTYVLVVNPGSNSISLFKRDGSENELQFMDVQQSGGVDPISITQSGRFIYVLNSGDANHAGNVQEFVRFHDQLVLIADGSAALSAPQVGPAQVSFTPAGDALVVTEKGTNMIDVFGLDYFDRPASSNFQPSVGQTPFGFDYGPHGLLFVSEAYGGSPNLSTVSSYKIRQDLSLKTISSAVPSGQTAACWLVTSSDGSYFYTSNTGSGDVSGYSVNYPQGTISLFNDGGITGITGGKPIDATLADGGKYYYVLSAGTNVITTFRIMRNGALKNLGSISGVPSGAAGLASDD